MKKLQFSAIFLTLLAIWNGKTESGSLVMATAVILYVAVIFYDEGKKEEHYD